MLEMIFTKEELKRITIVEEETGKNIYVDVHAMNRREAKQFVHNIIALIRGSYTVTVIHGWNNGTKLKDMFRTEQISNRVTQVKNVPYNYGETQLLVA